MKLIWHEASGQWAKIVGKKLDKSGKRLVKGFHYLGTDRMAAEAEAERLKAEWKKLKASWAASHAGYLKALDEPFAEVPHWYKAGGRGTAVTEEDVAAVRAAADEAAAEEAAYEYRDAPLSEIHGLYLQDRKSGEGVDFRSHSNKTHEQDLALALRHLPTQKAARLLSADDVRDCRRKMKRSGLRDRTIHNAGVALKAFLAWYWGSALFEGGKRRGDFDKAFGEFPKRLEAKPRYLSADELRLLLAKATPRRRLYLLLMLNTGMQPTDVAAVQAEAFDLETGIVKWERHKNDRVDRDYHVEVQSKLWPETMVLVRRFIQRKGLAFRTVEGKPLSKVTGERDRNNAVAKACAKLFRRLRQDSKLKISAKNLRQTGGQRIQEAVEAARGEHSGLEAARLWLGRNFEAVDRPYLSALYETVFEAQDAYGASLRAAGVFPDRKG